MESANSGEVPTTSEGTRTFIDVHQQDNTSFGSRRLSIDTQLRAPSDGSHAVFSSLSTTPTEYQSCSDPSTPDRKNAPEELGPSEDEPEVTCVNMSANIASKLNEIRASLENLDFISECSFDDLEVAEDVTGPGPQDVGPTESLSSSKRSLSKQSLRQVFPYIPCLPFENNIVFCFVLSVWDNIVGPQTVYVWKRKSFPSQKTFDDMIDGKENLEFGEAYTSTPQLFPQHQLKDDQAMAPKPETNLADIDPEKVEERIPSRKASSPKEHIVKSEGGDLPRADNTPSEHTIKHSSDENKPPSNKTRKNSGSDSSLPSHSIGEEGKMDSQRGSLKDGRSTDESNQAKKTKAGTSHNQAASFSEVDGQEFGGSWACGRSRLRMGAVVRYVTEHSVGVGQVGPPSEKILPSLLVVEHQGIIVVAARFTVAEDDSGVPYCLSMVVPLEEYDYFLPLIHTVTTWLINIAATTRLLITKHGLEAGGRIRNKLVELCDILVALRSASLDQYPLTPAGRPPDDRRLAEIILTSHLQTLGSTVVVADSPNAANKVVMWIAQFSDPSDLPISRLCLSYTQWSFHPGLAIQGIVKSATGEVNLSAQKLIQSSRPLTVVDVSRGIVKQTGSPDVHARRNVDALHQELLSLWHDLPDVSAPSESLLEPVRAAAPLVKRFLHDYDRLSSCDSEVRQNFIKAFLRSLQYTALAVITWTQHEWAVQRRRTGYDNLKQALCSVFDLDDSDLRIILAQAEGLQPGFYSYAMT